MCGGGDDELPAASTGGGLSTGCGECVAGTGSAFDHGRPLHDRLLDLNIFPAEVAATEMAYYKTVQRRYGLPLDNREDYTKNDWILWSACLTGNQADFEALMQPVWDFANETPSRIPLSDWYFTTSGKHRGFQVRSVVGGFFLRMLEKQLGK